ITAERLKRVAAAEAWLLARGWPQVRVRSQGQTARIELPAAQLDRALGLWAKPETRQALVAAFLEMGFSAVGLDLEGLVSGKLNRELGSAKR
ncbi:MAG: TIGR00268 family protein, partial [Cyanobium sp. MAG_237]|nr:TIGR00268 family protein [Cyanobium sp. MAG_237]